MGWKSKFVVAQAKRLWRIYYDSQHGMASEETSYLLLHVGVEILRKRYGRARAAEILKGLAEDLRKENFGSDPHSFMEAAAHRAAGRRAWQL